MFIYTYSVDIPVTNSKHTLTILASLMLVAGMPMAFADGHASDGLTITADAVEGSTTITITGHATSSSTPVTIMVLAPNGNVVSIDQINPDSDGSFTSTIGVGGPMWKQDGVYLSLIHI